MSVGSCEQKNTPTPLDRISFTVCSTWSRNAFDASSNSRCASSKINTSSGLSASPFSGRSWNSSASTHMRNVENSTGRVAWSPSSTSEIVPFPSTTLRRSAGSSSGSPKNVSPPLFDRFTKERRMTPAVCDDTPPMPLRSSFPSSEVRCWSTARRSLRSYSSSPCSSAQWKTSPSVDSWVELSPSTFDNRIGPNELTRARSGTPMPSVPSDRNSTGCPAGAQSAPVCSARPRALSESSPGFASPDRSPFMSAITTGTPFTDNCSAIN